MVTQVTGKDLETPIETNIRDNIDGSYTCMYVVPKKGDYTLSVSINDQAVEVS